MNKRMEVKIIGRVVGSASGWDQATDQGLQFYDFEPVAGVCMAVGVESVYIDWLEGIVEGYNEDGSEVLCTYDLVDWTKDIRKSE